MDHSAKRELFDAFSKLAHALGSGRRLEIIDILAQGERSVEELSKEIDQSLANTSHHLQVLSRVGLVRSRREGTFIYYFLAFEEVEQLWSSLRKVAERSVRDLDWLAERYLGNAKDVEWISREDLIARATSENVLIIDVRPAYEYVSGHIPGALSVPLEELDDFMSGIPEVVTVVAYCRGPYCVFAPEAVRRLALTGIKAVRLEEGFPEWKAAGFPVVTGVSSGTFKA